MANRTVGSTPIWQKPNADVVKKLAEHGHECAIAAPVWNELSFGCERMPKGKRRDALEAYLNDVVLASFEVLPYDQQAAQWHGVEHARLEKLGRPAPFVDGQIASMAHANELTLVTTNTKDFSRFKGLKIENWAK